MNYKSITSVLVSGLLVSATVMANEPSKEYKIHIFKGCDKIDSLAMTQAQIDAYEKLTAMEEKFEKLELPLDEMDEQLDKYQIEMELLQADMVIESEDRVIINKSLIDQQTKLAKKIEQIVHSYQPDIKAIEQQAEEMSKLADEFQQVMAPAIKDYKDVNIQIGGKAKVWGCEV